MESAMTNAINPTKSPALDMKFEIAVIPVSDVDRAKAFYANLGWRLDADYASGDDYRVIQFTPPGSNASVIFGKNVTAAAPGSAQGLYLIVSDIAAARKELLDRGVKVSEAFHDAGGIYAGRDEPYLFGRKRIGGEDPEHRSYRSFASFNDPTAMAGCSSKSRSGCPDAWKRTRASPRHPISQRRCAARP